MTTSRTAQLLTFLVDNDEYALDIMRVREIANPLPVRPIPGAPLGLAGVINLRQSEVLPVIDLRARFGLPLREEGATRRIIVCVVEGRLVGIFVDDVVDVIDIKIDEIRGGSAIFKGRAAGRFSGICRYENRLLLLLNLKRLLSTEDRIAIDTVHEQIGALDEKEPV